MTWTRKAVLPLVAALVLLAGSAASAAEDPTTDTTDGVAPLSTSQCASGAFCVWSGASGSGSFESTTSTTSRDLVIGTVSSVWNRSSNAARIYSGSGGTGTSVCYAPGAYVASTSVAAGSFRLLLGTSC